MKFVTKALQDLEAATKKHEKAQALAPALPFEPHLLVHHADYVALNFKVDNVADLRKVVEVLGPTKAMAFHKNGTASFVPVEKAKGGETIPCEPIWMDFDPNSVGYPLNSTGLEFNWLADVSDVSVKVSVEIMGDPSKFLGIPTIDGDWRHARAGRPAKLLSQRLNRGEFAVPGLVIGWQSFSQDRYGEYSLYYALEESSSDPLKANQVMSFIDALG
jgi:hypothetical protein